MNKEDIINNENIHRKIKEEILEQNFHFSKLLDEAYVSTVFGFDEKEIYEYHTDNWKKVENNIINRMSDQLDENLNIKIETETELEQKLNEKGYTKYIGLNYSRSDLEKQFPFFKNFWYRGVSYYSYSIKIINDYFGRKVLEDNTPMTAYVINYLIHLYHKYMYWDEFK